MDLEENIPKNPYGATRCQDSFLDTIIVKSFTIIVQFSSVRYSSLISIGN